MSGIAGIVHFDGREVEPGQIEAMTTAMNYRGPDGIRHWVHGNVALGQCLLRTTKESLEEAQPLANEAGTVTLVMDGIFDNSGELRAQLLAAGAVLRNASHAELALRGFEVWGLGLFSRIHGDFAIAIHAAAQHRLILARDIMGTRPLHYRKRGTSIEFASDMSAMLASPDADLQPNLGMIAEFLSAEVVSRTDTVYESVQRLPAGHYAILTADGRWTLQTYWTPDTSALRNHARDEDYVEELIHILRNGLAQKTQGLTGVAMLLSGGVDSPLIFGMLRDMQRKGIDVPEVHGFSMVFPGESSDESHYLQQIHRFWETRGCMLPGWVAPAEYFVDQAAKFRNLPDSPNGAMSQPIKEEIRRQGYRTVLTGCGGDEFFCGRNETYLDSILRGDAGLFLSLVRGEEQSIGNGLRTAIVAGLKRVPAAYQTLRQLKGNNERAAFPWINPTLIREGNLHERLRSTPTWFPRKFSSNENRAVFSTAFNGWMSLNAEGINLTYSHCGIEVRHPLWSRDIIEFALSLPVGQRWRGGPDKRILRNASRAIVPPGLLARNDKTTFENVFRNVFEQDSFSEWMRQLPTSGNDWLDAQGVHALVNRINASLHFQPPSHASAFGADLWPMWMVLAIDAWRQSAVR